MLILFIGKIYFVFESIQIYLMFINQGNIYILCVYLFKMGFYFIFDFLDVI